MIVDKLAPSHPEDWLIVAGDVADKIPDVIRAIKPLARRFAKVIWVPATTNYLIAAPTASTAKRATGRLWESCAHLV